MNKLYIDMVVFPTPCYNHFVTTFLKIMRMSRINTSLLDIHSSFTPTAFSQHLNIVVALFYTEKLQSMMWMQAVIQMAKRYTNTKSTRMGQLQITTPLKMITKYHPHCGNPQEYI